MSKLLKEDKYFVLQYKTKRRGAEWIDFWLYTNLEHAKTMYTNAIASGLNWWSNKHLRLIHRIVIEDLVQSSEPVETNDQ